MVTNRLALVALVLMCSSPAFSYTKDPLRPPPGEPIYEVTPGERSGYEWVSGHWEWTGTDYVWSPGRWIESRSGYVWVPDNWWRRGKSWYLNPGHWVPESGDPKAEADARPPVDGAALEKATSDELSYIDALEEEAAAAEEQAAAKSKQTAKNKKASKSRRVVRKTPNYKDKRIYPFHKK